MAKQTLDSSTVERWARSYLRFYSYVEGPELEPNIFHSHYLSVHALSKLAQHTRTILTGDVLDVGAGTGHGKRFLPPQATYYPTDIESARSHIDAALTRRGIPLVKYCSVYDIDFEPDRFDACMALSLMEHLDSPDKAITEIRRVVKGGGLIVIQVPFAFPVHGYPTDYWRWTEEGIKLLLRKNGIEPLHTITCGRSVHTLFLNANLLLREGLFLDGYKPTAARAALHVVIRPLLTVLFLLSNVSALFLGLFDRSKTFPIHIACIGRNDK